MPEQILYKVFLSFVMHCSGDIILDIYSLKPRQPLFAAIFQLAAMDFCNLGKLNLHCKITCLKLLSFYYYILFLFATCVSSRQKC